MQEPVTTDCPSSLASWAAAIGQALQAEGADYRAIFADLGLEYEKTRDSRARFTLRELVPLWTRAAEVTGNPAFGLLVPQHLTSTSFYSLTLAFDASATLREALQRLARLSHLATSAADLVLTGQPDGNLALTIAFPVELREHVPCEAVDAFLYTVAIRCNADDLVEVCLTRPPPGDAGPWRRAFRCRVNFAAERDEIIFSKRALDTHRSGSSRLLAETGESLALDYLKTMQRDHTRYQVEREIRCRLDTGEPRQADIALALSISARQLQRRLAAENTTYADILQYTRQSLARLYLADSERSIVDISYSLGYTDPSNFSSAFRRWQGESPKQFRNRLRLSAA